MRGTELGFMMSTRVCRKFVFSSMAANSDAALVNDNAILLIRRCAPSLFQLVFCVLMSCSPTPFDKDDVQSNICKVIICVQHLKSGSVHSLVARCKLVGPFAKTHYYINFRSKCSPVFLLLLHGSPASGTKATSTPATLNIVFGRQQNPSYDGRRRRHESHRNHRNYHPSQPRDHTYGGLKTRRLRRRRYEPQGANEGAN
jgi:hypothetical protein